MRNIAVFILIFSIIFSGCTSTPKPTDNIELTIEVTSTATSGPIHENASLNKSISVGGYKRIYSIYTPKSYTGNETLPLVIYFHSYDWSPKQDMKYTMLNQVADSNNFIIVYPSAVGNWNSGIGEITTIQTRDVNEVEFIDALIDHLGGIYNIDLDRVYATGYSNGGFMAYKLACQLSHRIAAIASVGGVISTNTLADCNPIRPMPVLQIHGTDDPNVPINGMTGWQSVEETLNFWIQNNNCLDTNTITLDDIDLTDECTVNKISYTNCSENANIVFLKVINGGHSWPSAGPTGFLTGNTNQDINAGTEIWNFFEQFSLSALGE